MTGNEEAGASRALLELSTATSDATSMSEIAAVLSRTAAPLVGAANAAVGMVDGTSLRIFQGPTATAGNASIRLHDLDVSTPLTDALRTRQPVLIGTAREFEARYPAIFRRTQPGEIVAMAAYPLSAGDDTLGACFFRFAEGSDLADTRFSLMEQMVPVLERGVARIQDRAELVAYAERLEQSNRDLDNFAAVVAHDLSAPVRRIGSFLQLLEREIGPLNGTARRYADTIGQQVSHLDALLQDTLAYAQVVAPTTTRQPIALQALMDELLAEMAADLDQLEATVTIDPLPVLDAEMSLIHQVFANLFDNALKYRHETRSPAIAIAATQVDREDSLHQWWRLAFADNGIGIDPARYDDVFAMFLRLEATKDRPGTGVGMAFVKRVVERHGGTIGIEQTPGGGTTFWFTLPGPIVPDVL